jgi:hypothetical protein
MESARTRSRPVGVIVMAIVFLLGAALNVLAATDLFGLTAGNPLAAQGPIAVPTGLLMLIWGVVSVPTAYGVFAMTSWGWTLAVGMSVVGFLQNAMQYVNDNSLLIAMVVTAIVPALFLWYLSRPHVRAAFRRAG